MSSLSSPLPWIQQLNSNKEIDLCDMNLLHQAEPIIFISSSPDGNRLLAGFSDFTARVFESKTGKEEIAIRGAGSLITCGKFISSDKVVIGTASGALQIWNFIQGSLLFSLKGHDRRINSVAVDRTGKLIASASWDASVRIWNANDGSQNQVVYGHDGPVNCVEFFPEDQIIVSASWDKTIRVFDTFNRKRIAVLKGHTSSIRSLCISPSGRYIASGSNQGALKIWSTVSYTQVGGISAHDDSINSLCFTKDGSQLISASESGVIKAWASHMGKQLMAFAKKEESKKVLSAFALAVEISHDLKRIAVGYNDGSVTVYDLASGDILNNSVRHNLPIRTICWSVDDQLIASGSDDSSICLGRSTHNSPKKREDNLNDDPNLKYLRGHEGQVNKVILSEDGQLLCSASNDMTTRIWDVKEGKEKLIHKAHNSYVTSCAVSENKRFFLSCSRDNSMILWDLWSKSQIKTFPRAHDDWVNDVCFSPKVENFFSCSNDFLIKMWDQKSGQVTKTFSGHLAAVNCLSYSNGFILSGSSDGQVKLWNKEGAEVTTLLGHILRINSCDLKLNKDQRLAAISSDDGIVSLWDPLLGDQKKLVLLYFLITFNFNFVFVLI